MNGPIIYSIGLLFGSNSSHRARHDLQVLSNETGGIAFFPKSLEEVDGVAAEIARDIRNQYAIAYRPPNPEITGYHSVTVKAQSYGRDLTVHTRLGYLVNSGNKIKP